MKANSTAAQLSNEEKRPAEYLRLAFVLRKPYSTQNITKPSRVHNKAEHKLLIDEAKKKNAYVWYASVVEQDGKFFAVPPWVVDFDSVDNLHPTYNNAPGVVQAVVNVDATIINDSLTCSICGRVCTSKPGLTLHRKAAHADPVLNEHD